MLLSRRGFSSFFLLLLFPRPSPSYLPVVPGSEAPGVRAIRVRSSLPSESCRPGGTLFLSFFPPFYRSLPLSAAFIIVLESERPGRPLLKNRAREEREINRRTSEIENKERIPSRASPRGWFPHSRFFFFFFFFSLLLVGQPVAGRSNFSLFSRLKRRLF